MLKLTSFQWAQNKRISRKRDSGLITAVIPHTGNRPYVSRKESHLCHRPSELQKFPCQNSVKGLGI